MNEEIAAKRGLGMIPARRELEIYTAYQTALNACERLITLDPELATPEGQLLHGMAVAIETYENEMYPMFKKRGD